MVITAAALGWTALFAPLCAAVLIWLFGLHRKGLSAALAIAGLLLSLACASLLFLRAIGPAPSLTLPFESSVSWLTLTDITIPFGVLIDRLSLLMALVVTGVGSAIFIYAVGYMRDDPGFSRFFGTLSFFACSMLGIVLANNWVQLFIAWELVGFSSYALIGFWYEKPSAADAGKKAFMVNRVADFGFLLGILMLWAVSGTVNHGARTIRFAELEALSPQLAQHGAIAVQTLPWIGLLLFCGVMGKSAQFPLHVWLPDAMEGPTPVSALIHAATMVAAGVYLLCRAFFLFAAVPDVLQTIAAVGAITAFLSGCLALVESDLKRILAYSTLSQLGYMVMALGLGGYVPGMFHLTTHAFFKALLFLGAGSVIHATHKQHIGELGGLFKTMPITATTFLIGALALCGFPGLSGFYSKEEILTLAFTENRALFWIGAVTAGITACYMGRLIFVAFLGRSHATGDGAGAHQAHESPLVMTLPLVFLAILSIIGGFIGIPAFLHQAGEVGAASSHIVPMISLSMAAAGIVIAWLIYGVRVIPPERIAATCALLRQWLVRKYYLDDFYDWLVQRVQQRLVAGVCAVFEKIVIIGVAVNGTAWVARASGGLLRRAQTGKIQTYALVFFLGVTVLLYALILAR